MVVIDNLDVHDDLVFWGHLEKEYRGRALFFLWWGYFCFVLNFEGYDIKDLVCYTIEHPATADRIVLW